MTVKSPARVRSFGSGWRRRLSGKSDWQAKFPTPPVNCERAAAQSNLAVPEILDHGLKRLAADMNGTGEGIFDQRDHKRPMNTTTDRMPVIMT